MLDVVPNEAASGSLLTPYCPMSMSSMRPRKVQLAPHFQDQSPLKKLQRIAAVFKVLFVLVGLVLVGLAARYVWIDGAASMLRSRIINEGNQIVGAVRAQQADNKAAGVAPLAQLKESGYLSDIPKGWRDAKTGVHAELPGLSPDLCKRLNDKAGMKPGKRVVEVVKDETTEQTSNFGCLVESRTAFFHY